MNEQEIKAKLKRLKEGQLQGDEWMTAYEWLMDELGRQLDRNQRLDKQLAGLVEAGEPFLVFTENQFGDSSDSEYPIFEEGDFTVGKFRRLAQAMREVKDGD